MKWFLSILSAVLLLQPSGLRAGETPPCTLHITHTDALLMADPDGRIICVKNGSKGLIPASTIKVLTALTAIKRLGPSYRFRTEFYTDPFQNLKVKGYGDPLLTSEIIHDLAGSIGDRINRFRSLILDNTYFVPHLNIPGCGRSTNPYDAPVGALCANFNTAFFRRDRKGDVVSSEMQTPMIPFVRKRVRSLGLKGGRQTLVHDSREAALYFGELLLHFLNKRGVKTGGSISLGPVGPDDRLIYTYESAFTLETVIQKMLKSSSNFMANQIFISLGARTYGPPGTLAKGVSAVMDYARAGLHLKDLTIVEGSGISRENRISANGMLTVLKGFRPYRDLLRRKDALLYKTGSLKEIRTEVGYVESRPSRPYYFVVFFNRPGSPMNATIRCVKKTVIDYETGR
ncbi:MAG: D-alanyl-D-alanine carboxypeptidase [Deltaproteobacteria bacterium]|nr:D-alanyl-D-alanine carboxypeptidase [Deltaproteobacteria bacterium]